jgi:hypothetical protein
VFFATFHFWAFSSWLLLFGFVLTGWGGVCRVHAGCWRAGHTFSHSPGHYEYAPKAKGAKGPKGAVSRYVE